MTYEEYKSNNTKKNKSSILNKLLNKLFTVIIFTISVIIISNYSETFRNFLIDDVLNKSMDFSKVNNIISKFTSIFEHNNTEMVIKEENKQEKYKDGIKYYVSNNSSVKLNSSGIVTYIGNKDDYNNTVIVEQSNGYYAWYGNIKESVKLYDYIESGNIIGTTNGDFYYYVLYKDDKPITNES